MARSRVYAVTGKNKLLCSPLYLLITAQAIAGAVSMAAYLRLPGRPFDACPLTPVDEHPDKHLPEEILNVFRLCTNKQWKPAVLVYTILALTFGAFSPSIFDIRCSKNCCVLRCRYPRLLDSHLYSKERAAAYIMGDKESLDCHSAGCDAVLHDHIFHSILCPVVPVCHCGKCRIVRSKVLRSSWKRLQQSIQILPSA